MSAFGVESIHVGGVIGERLDRTIQGNLLKIDFDTPQLLTDFEPAKRVNRPHAYTGLGKSMVAAVYFAAYTGGSKVTALKDHLISAIIASLHSCFRYSCFGIRRR